MHQTEPKKGSKKLKQNIVVQKYGETIQVSFQHETVRRRMKTKGSKVIRTNSKTNRAC